MRTNIKTEEHGNDAVQAVSTGQRNLAIEETAEGDPEQDERPQCLDIASAPMLVHVDRSGLRCAHGKPDLNRQRK